MDPRALHLELRNALAVADELSRHAHVLGSETIAGYLASVRTVLGELERTVGSSHRRAPTAHLEEGRQLERAVDFLRERLEAIPLVLRPRLVHLMASLERIVFAVERPAAPVPAKRMLGGLPIARVVPQGAHSVFDYLAAGGFLLSAGLARTPRARLVGLVLGLKFGGASLLTDYRLAPLRKLPIELHEGMDYAVGIGAVVTPLAFGYRKKDRVASAIQMAVGLATVLVSLVTDYRAHRGVVPAVRARSGKRLLVPRARRHGLSAASA